MAKKRTQWGHGIKLHLPTPSYPKYRLDFKDLLHDGKRSQPTFSTYEEAVERAVALEKSFDRGLGVNAQKKLSTLIHEVIEEYLKPENHLGEWNGHTPKTRKSVVDTWILPYLPNKPANEVTKSDLKKTYGACMAGGRAPATVKGVWAALKGLIGWAIDEGYIYEAANPLAGLKCPKTARRVQGKNAYFVSADRIPTRKDVERLAQEMEKRSGWRYGFAVTFSVWSGVRYGELTGLTVHHLFPESHRPSEGWTLPQQVTVRVERQFLDKAKGYGLPKHNKMREAYIPAFLRPQLQRLVDMVVEEMEGEDAPNVQGLLFPSPQGGNMRRASWYSHYFYPAYFLAGWRWSLVPSLRERDEEGEMTDARKKLRRLAGLTLEEDGMDFKYHWSWHSLRHFYATTMLAPQTQGGGGYSIQQVSAWLGHSSTAFTLDTYVSLSGGSLSPEREMADPYETTEEEGAEISA